MISHIHRVLVILIPIAGSLLSAAFYVFLPTHFPIHWNLQGHPSDNGCLQSAKHATIRMRELTRTDVQAISIINHQRHLPALDRDNVTPFREEIIIAAEQQHVGLMTTWELFRLARSFLRNKWLPKHIKACFYRFPRIAILPMHYEQIGIVENFYKRPNAVSIRINEGMTLHQGDIIAFETAVEFVEQRIDSMQIDDKAAEMAEGGSLAGIKCKYPPSIVRKDMVVYRAKYER